MKTILFTIVINCFVFTNTVTAVPTGNGLASTIRSKITYPVFAIEANIQGDMSVNFTIDESGKTIVNYTTYENEKLGKYLASEIQKIELSEYKDS
jgi:hypothetical protein